MRIVGQQWLTAPLRSRPLPENPSREWSKVAEGNRLFRRTEASTYLKEAHGIPRTPSTLAKLATLGGGPKFHRANRVPLYPQTELDAWAISILGPLRSSTSDK